MFRWLFAVFFGWGPRERSLLHRFGVRVFNLLAPWVLRLPWSRPSLRNQKRGVVVSLTSFPERIHVVPLVIESILHQHTHPDAIVLWLSREEFPTEDSVPADLRRLQRRGVTIAFVSGNLKSHKKYLYAFDRYPDSAVITIDDDAYYPPSLITDLLTNHRQFPGTVIATKARQVLADHNGFLPYVQWPRISDYVPPSHQLLSIGGGGVLYPPRSLSARVFDIDRIAQLALHADDLWIKFAHEGRALPSMCIGQRYTASIIPVRAALNTPALFSRNVIHGGNDVVLSALKQAFSIDTDVFVHPTRSR